MPESLAARIAESLLTGEARYYDESLSETVRLRAQRNPWIREVIRVEKKYHSKDPRAGVVEVEASFRMPIAKARWAAGFAYFDEDGYRLPAADVPRWVATVDAGAGQGERSVYFIHRGDARPGMKLAAWHHVLIEGAAANLPAIGKRWGGDDVGAGLKLIKVISPKPYAWQITAVDVRNYGGRVSRFEPHLRMYAQVARVQPTDIRFGRFSMPEGDFNVSVERKLSYLDQYAAEHDGYLAGINSYLDLRYDELHVSVN